MGSRGESNRTFPDRQSLQAQHGLLKPPAGPRRLAFDRASSQQDYSLGAIPVGHPPASTGVGVVILHEPGPPLNKRSIAREPESR
jgi:hypothetical protein